MDNSVIILTADHGENLGEHHSVGHGHPYEQGLRIPLMIHLPGDWMAGTRLSQLVEITDIIPTAMDLVNLTKPEQIDGMSFVELLKNPDTELEHRKYLLALGGANNEKARTYSLFDGKYRLIKGIRWSKEPLLYNIRLDPHETENIAADHVE